MKYRFHPRILACCALTLVGIAQGPASSMAQEASAEQRSYEGVTSEDPTISLDHLRVLLRPLNRDELTVEAHDWLELLRAKIKEVGSHELSLKPRKEKKSGKGLEKDLVELRTQESDLVQRLRIVLAALKAKGGDVEEMEQFVDAVTDLGETKDTTSYRAAVVALVKAWIVSEDGGQRLARRGSFALLILFAFWVMSKFAGRIISRWLSKQPSASNLLEDFARRTTGGAVFIIGVLMALSVLGVEIGPMMAALGAGGFIVGFALQETLGSFASGLMIMVYRPFDVDDYVSIAGDEGTVKQMSLVSTTLLTVDNKVVVVPNKKAWSDTIVNYTGKDIRRVDLVFGISYDDDIKQAIELLTELAREHALTLDEPALSVRVHELADSSVNIFCRPWARTRDYWSVYWDLTHQVKERFDQAGISFPYPQQDVHLDGLPNARGETSAHPELP